MRPFLLPLTLIALLLAIGVALWQFTAPPSSAPAPKPTVQQPSNLLGGDFALLDTARNTRTPADFAGRYMLVYFGYSFCPDICPTDLLRMTKLLKMLGEDADALAPIFISVDPERDTPEHLANYMTSFDPRITALTGSIEAVEAAKKVYKVYSTKATPDGTTADYLVDHSSLTYLMDGQGRYLAHFSHTTPVETMVTQIRLQLEAETRKE
jgi:cytochrome oxidase Cu insertion factor (SCO1/SenC/PrrC family)